jgi:hypothetical protein
LRPRRRRRRRRKNRRRKRRSKKEEPFCQNMTKGKCIKDIFGT